MSRFFGVALSRLLLAVLALAPRGALAAAPPAPTRWVTDEAGFLSASTREDLDRRLEEYQQRSGHQVLVWIGRTTGGIPIEDFAVRAFAAWRVGRQGLDDGIVVFIFAEDRQVRIEVGYGLEGQVPDAIAVRIIGGTIVPRIQAGDRDGAVVAGVEALIAAIDGQAPPARVGPSPARPAQPEAPGSLNIVQKILVGLAALAFLILFITHPSFALYLLFSILSGGRSGGGSGGGGGFSGGGGRSGGGGASGRW